MEVAEETLFLKLLFLKFKSGGISWINTFFRYEVVVDVIFCLFYFIDFFEFIKLVNLRLY